MIVAPAVPLTPSRHAVRWLERRFSRAKKCPWRLGLSLARLVDSNPVLITSRPLGKSASKPLGYRVAALCFC